jgi:RpiB/LacA/LacB family sugar-phosphate isomerase
MRNITLYSGPLCIGSDHGGYALKKRLTRFITNELHRTVDDVGPHEYRDDDDYPVYTALATAYVRKEHGRGILICRNGIGVCMHANKYADIRAGIGYNIAAAESMRTDDNTNILCLAADHVSDDHACAIVRAWLMTPFSEEERHIRRLRAVQDVEHR